MIHYFTVLYECGDYFNIQIEGGTVEECNEYLQQHSKDVRYVKSLDRKPKYKTSKDLGFGKLIYCKYISRPPKGAKLDTRMKVWEDERR